MNFSPNPKYSRRRLSWWLVALCAAPAITTPRLVHAAPAKSSKSPVHLASAVAPDEAAPRAAHLTLPMGRTSKLPLQPGAKWKLEKGQGVVRVEVQDGVLQLSALAPGEAILQVTLDGDIQRYALRVPAPDSDSDAPTPPAAAPAAPAALATPVTHADAQMSNTHPEGVSTPPETTKPETPPPASNAATKPADTPSLPPIAPSTNGSDNSAPRGVPDNTVVAPQTNDDGETPRISPSLQAPTQNPKGRAPFPTKGKLPSGVGNGGNARAPIVVTQGLARLLTFPSNILAVFFSDVNVMDARAINARTVAVTGVANGQSTLAVFTARYPGDAVGRANIFRISVEEGAKTSADNAADLETSISGAIGDPRVHVTIIRSPRGNAVVRLSGTVRDASEAEAAKLLAGLYVPTEQIISTITVSPTAPTLDAALANPAAIGGGSEVLLQNSLRQLTGNQTIEIVSLPTGVGLKATVSSPSEAEALLNLVPVSADRPVLPFIVIHSDTGATTTGGTTGGNNYYQRAALTAEDQSMTRTLQAVTGVSTVYVTRTTQSGLAIYGTARNRVEYESVRRYATLLSPASGGLAANSISTGSTYPLGVQFFVRILDPAGQSIRRINVQTSVVEINRQAARQLGVEIGSASVVTGSTTGSGTSEGTFNSGAFLLGGGGSSISLGNINPFRARISALYSNGLARVLSQPNVSAVEGADAQITIGGQRPVPSAAIAGGSSGGSTVGQSVEFRRFGIILTMRPTVTDDDTIILQVRADVSQLDATSGITLNGSFIPGESVRSIDTTITLRDGDTLAMGGLITNDRRESTSRIPVLSQIPILGALFKSKQFQNNETELAIFMTPRIERLQTTPGTIQDVVRIPALPALPGVQQQNQIFAFSQPGQSGGGSQ